jgi:hypothetical protein
MDALLFVSEPIGEWRSRVSLRVCPPRPPPRLRKLSIVVGHKLPSRLKVLPLRQIPEGSLPALA